MNVFRDKNVLITGGTGSFGKKFVQIALAELQPKKLVIFSRDELKQHEMRTGGFDDPRLRWLIGDVRDAERMRRALKGIDIVVHAAALKQVPACEFNPFEAIQTNVMGARHIIDAAIDCGVKKVIALSTDKAVSPVNLYGATKLCAEKLFVQGNAYVGESDTAFTCVRYGNVVGSRGSVIPIFLEQKKSGRVTVTDERMTRFWITLEQGVRFVIRCADLMHGGEVFVPKIPSTSMVEVAKALAPDARIEYVGIRAGEKLHEVMVSEDEARHTVDLGALYQILPANQWWSERDYAKGTPLPEGFTYASHTNPWKLTPDEILKLVEEPRSIRRTGT